MLKLRRAKEGDCRLLWEWRNEPDVRLSAFDPEPIEWMDHVRWFQSRLQSPKCFIYIIETLEGLLVGQVRFDIRDNKLAEIDIHIQKDQRGRGYGLEALRLACDDLVKNVDLDGLLALVKSDNHRSIRLFHRAGFRERKKCKVKGFQAIEMIRRVKRCL
ncbi:MAG: GNAT family N-acetyltransferase [Candidatus Omnitrophica bacterium]|nr:GNAT family N-acetyltransferase [Candidatus Omnitrophota bacterium]